MKIIKEFVRIKLDDSARIILRTNYYIGTFEYIRNLVNEARKDFSLEDDKIEIIHYAGDRYKGTYGIEFNVDKGVTIPEKYKEVSQVEFKL